MKKQEELFELIKSLSQTEKRYFKLFCQQQVQDSNYFVLFDAIDKQQEYDEQELKKKFRKEKFIKQLHVTKNYLRSLILKSLRNYHHKTSKEAEVKDALRNVEILFFKELYPICFSELKKAERLARSYELDTALIDVQRWNRRIHQAIAPANLQPVEALLKEEEKTIQGLSSKLEHWKAVVGAVQQYGNNIGPRLRAKNKVKLPTVSPTLEEKVLYHHTKFHLILQEGKGSQSVKPLYQLLDYLETEKQKTSEEPRHYLSTVNNLLSYLVFNKRHDDALQLVARAKQTYDEWKIETRSRVILKQMLRTYNIELEIYRDTKTFKTGEATAKHVVAFLEKNQQKVPEEYLLLFWFQFASLGFMQKKYTDALKWINKILNYHFNDSRPDLQLYTRLLNLLIHFELNNMFVLGYYIDSTRRYLKKHGELDRWKKTLLKYFSRLRQVPVFEQKDVFCEMKSKLLPENGKPLLDENVLDYIDLKSWMEEKANGNMKKILANP